MDFVFDCLYAFEITFIMSLLFLPLFFNFKQVLVHRFIIDSIIATLYLIDAALCVYFNRVMVVSLLLAIIWYMCAAGALDKLKRFKQHERSKKE